MVPSRNRMPTQVASAGTGAFLARVSGPCTDTSVTPPISPTTRCQWLEATDTISPMSELRLRHTQSTSGVPAGRTSNPRDTVESSRTPGSDAKPLPVRRQLDAPV
jgi:hypothetical protein